MRNWLSVGNAEKRRMRQILIAKLTSENNNFIKILKQLELLPENGNK
jgi:hypothetical protein